MSDPSSERAAFADFLVRLAQRAVSIEEWNAFTVSRYNDAATERARVTLTRRAMGLQQCSGCLVPPGLDAVAQELREQLLEAP